MQRQPGPGNDPRKNRSTQQFSAVNGTGKGHGVPQRPPGMAPHIDQPPPTPRVGRPVRVTPQPKHTRRRFILWGIITVIVIILLWGIIYGATNLFNGIQAAAGPATAASSFLGSIQQQDYTQAFNDLGASPIGVDTFKQQATQLDTCYGPVTNYVEVSGSAIIQGNNQIYVYTITRSKLQNTYQMHLTLQQDNQGNWKVLAYTNDSGGGNDLGPPGQPACGK